MASIPIAALCALVALLLWAPLGWLVARRLRLGDAVARLAVAPALGWALQAPFALVIARFTGLSLSSILGSTLVLAALAAWRMPRRADDAVSLAPARGSRGRWLLVTMAAAVLAVAPAAGVAPKGDSEAVWLASPVFDHSKAAIVDQMTREGVPPANPVWGGEPPARNATFAYYYLWHFGAAELARLAGASGWEADIGATGFTAFASLLLMAGLAWSASGSMLACVFVLALSACGSLRPVLGAAFGPAAVDQVIEEQTGLAGWLFQTSWSPHHVMAACASVLATALLLQLARRPSVALAAALALVLAAAFESSVWVGGVTLAVAGCAVALTIAVSMPARMRFLVAAALSAALAVLVAAPLLVAQVHVAAELGGEAQIALRPFYVLGPAFAAPWRRLLDLPAFWLVLLVVEFPLVAMVGAVTLIAGLRHRAASPWQDAVERRAFAALALASLVVGASVASVGNPNNDLGWRAVLPGLLVLTAEAGAGLASLVARRRLGALVAAAVVALLALPGGIQLAAANLRGTHVPSERAFARAPQFWAAVRRHTTIDARVSNNPLLWADLTPWPVNLSWALLANRRSCFAGEELAIAFAPMPRAQRRAIADRVDRIYRGATHDGDVEALAHELGCDAAVLSASDPAWSHDPFAANPAWRLVETRENEWRLYISVDAQEAGRAR